MLSATQNSTAIIRNYLILAATVMVMSVGLAETFTTPERAAQQDRMNTYGRYISAGLVSYAQKAIR